MAALVVAGGGGLTLAASVVESASAVAPLTSTQVTLTDSIGEPNRTVDGDPTSNAIDGDLGTFTYTTPSGNEVAPAYLDVDFASALVNRVRLYKDNSYGPHELSIQYATGSGPLPGRTWTNVSGLTNGINGSELLTATSVNSDGTVNGEDHQSPDWASLAFDGVTATGLRIGFSQSPGVGCCNHLQVEELQVWFDEYAPETTITTTPSSGWSPTSVHVTVAATDTDGTGVDSVRCVADPGTVPTSYDDMDPGCAYSGAGADTTSGEHTIYAASIDTDGNKSGVASAFSGIDGTAPTVVCDLPAPSFIVGGSPSDITATVTDVNSGPLESPASAAADLSAVGQKSAEVTGYDNAGNSTTVGCPYVVGYDVAAFGDLDATSWSVGSRIPATITLKDDSGATIADSAAKSLGRNCWVKVTFGSAAPICASYSAKTHAFKATIRTSRSTAHGPYTVALDVYAGSAVVNHETATVTIV